MKSFTFVALVAVSFLFANPGRSLAGENGFAGMHAQSVIKGRLCFTGHTHVGTGLRETSKKRAIASAAGDWSSFTAFEYGSDWAGWRIATAKQVECGVSASKWWTCEVQARPCLAGKRGSPKHAARR
jgi:hypothetical protein